MGPVWYIGYRLDDETITEKTRFCDMSPHLVHFTRFQFIRFVRNFSMEYLHNHWTETTSALVSTNVGFGFSHIPVKSSVHEGWNIMTCIHDVSNSVTTLHIQVNNIKEHLSSTIVSWCNFASYRCRLVLEAARTQLPRRSSTRAPYFFADSRERRSVAQRPQSPRTVDNWTNLFHDAARRRRRWQQLRHWTTAAHRWTTRQTHDVLPTRTERTTDCILPVVLLLLLLLLMVSIRPGGVCRIHAQWNFVNDNDVQGEQPIKKKPTAWMATRTARID